MDCRTCRKELTEEDLKTAVRHYPGDLECLDCYCVRADRDFERLRTLEDAGKAD